MDSGQPPDHQRRRSRQQEGQRQGQQENVHPFALVGGEELGVASQEVVDGLCRSEGRQDQKVDDPDLDPGGWFASTPVVHLKRRSAGFLWGTPHSDDIPTEGEEHGQKEERELS